MYTYKQVCYVYGAKNLKTYNEPHNYSTQSFIKNKISLGLRYVIHISYRPTPV